MNSNHITNIPEMVTAAAVAALTGPQDVPTQKNAEFQAKRDQVMAVMDAIPGVVCPRPQGAFYVFPDISVRVRQDARPDRPTIGNDVDFCNALLEAKGVACVPGSAFGEPRALRISYTCPTPQLRAGPAALPGILRRAEVTALGRFHTHRPASRFFGVHPQMKTPVRVAVTGAAGQIGYSLLFRIASGEMLGKDQPVILQMLELPLDKAQAALKGVMMELEDCAFPLLAGMVGTDDAEVAFKDADIALLVGARPRGPGMERKDLLLENAKIFTAQGAALNEVASRNVKVLVVGNPANTNAYIAMKSAPDLPAKNFTAMLRLDHNRALSQLATKAGVPVARHREAGRVGQPQPDDVSGLPLRHRRRRVAEGQDRRRRLERATTFIPKVGKRGAAIIEARGLSSAASAANAAIDHVRDWVLGSNGKWVTMGVPSDGSYGIPKDVMYGVPVTTRQRRVHARRGPAESTTSAARAWTRRWPSSRKSAPAWRTCC